MICSTKKPLNIWLLRDGETLPVVKDAKKMRTWRLGEALADRGHSVTWWTSNFFHSKKEKICEGNKVLKLRENLTVQFIDCGTYKKNISFQRIKHHFLLGKKFAALAQKEEKPDIIISSLPTLDFPMEAIKYGEKNNVPVIIDVRDMWPDLFIPSSPWFLRFFVHIPVFFYNQRMKFCLKKAQGIVSMSQDLLEWALKKANLEKNHQNKVFYLGYDESSANTLDSIEDLQKIPQDKIIFSYLGSFNHCNNPEFIVKAAKILEQDTAFKGFFVLAGAGDLWLSLKEKVKGSKNIILLNWLNKSQSAYLMNRTDVSLISSRGLSIPNKFFEALFFGKPVIFCMQGEAKSILENHNAGLFYQERDVHSLVSSLRNIAQEPRLQEMKHNAQHLYTTHFTAQKIHTGYCEYIEKIYKNGKNTER
jgi:glycosyltransferase involved in cell wall biosynthesis